MTRIDEELERRFDAALRPVEIPSAEGIDDRHARAAGRRRVTRNVASTAVALLIVASLVWIRTLIPNTINSGTQPPSPYPIIPATNGLIAVANGTSLSTIDPATGQIGRIRHVPKFPRYVAWSPDGSRIAVTVFRSDGTNQLWVLRADGSHSHLVPTATIIGAPSWSPDGSSIVYIAGTTHGSSIDIVSLNDGKNRVVGGVIPHGERSYFSVSFSPDGTQLLFDKGTDVGFGIFVMDINGGHLQQLSEGSADYDPAWSPDGRSIVFTRQEAAMKSDIFVMQSDGSDVRRLTDGGQTDTNLEPVWSPDGRLIAYVSGKHGADGGLVVMQPDGSAAETLITGGLLGIGWQPIRTLSTTLP